MAESMLGLKRTCRCAELSEANVGQTVTVMGWVAKQRNKGGLVFVDLRDRSGILQLIYEETDCGAENFAKAEKMRAEFVVAATGTVCKREAVNPNLATGAIEIRVKETRILSESETPPFHIVENSNTKEDLRLIPHRGEQQYQGGPAPQVQKPGPSPSRYAEKTDPQKPDDPEHERVYGGRGLP